VKIINRGKRWPRVLADLNSNEDKKLKIEFQVFDDMITLDIYMDPHGWKYLANFGHEYTVAFWLDYCRDLIDGFFDALEESGEQDENKQI
jgi:hypothetical protein